MPLQLVCAPCEPKNSNRTAGPVGRVLFALAMSIFTKLAKPEKMAWMFDYRIDWTPPSPPALQTARSSG